MLIDKRLKCSLQTSDNKDCNKFHNLVNKKPERKALSGAGINVTNNRRVYNIRLLGLLSLSSILQLTKNNPSIFVTDLLDTIP